MGRRLFHFSYKLYLTSLTFEGKIMAWCDVSNLFTCTHSMSGKETKEMLEGSWKWYTLARTILVY